MNMLGNGLRAYESGYYGGWGGRSEQGMRGISFAIADTSAQGMVNALGSMSGQSGRNSYPNFFPASQRDFAARMQWSVTPRYTDANHQPNVRIDGPLHIIAYAGQKIKLSGTVSDPDGDKVSVKWWHFEMPEDKVRPDIASPSALQTEMLISKEATKDSQFHIILEATDNGSPAPDAVPAGDHHREGAVGYFMVPSNLLKR